MYSFALNHKAYKIPSLASELSLGQFVDISQLPLDDELGLLSVLMGETPTVNVHTAKEAQQVQTELKNIFGLIEVLRQDLDRVINSGLLLIPPSRIQILGLDIEIKENFVKSLPYWGYIHTQQSIRKNVENGKDEDFNATGDIPGILAHYLYVLVAKAPYNEAKAEEFIEVVREVNFIQAMQLGNFFLIQQRKLWTSRGKRWIMRLTIWRLRLVSKFSRNTARRTPSTPSLEGIF